MCGQYRHSVTPICCCRAFIASSQACRINSGTFMSLMRTDENICTVGVATDLDSVRWIVASDEFFSQADF